MYIHACISPNKAVSDILVLFTVVKLDWIPMGEDLEITSVDFTGQVPFLVPNMKHLGAGKSGLYAPKTKLKKIK